MGTAIDFLYSIFSIKKTALGFLFLFLLPSSLWARAVLVASVPLPGAILKEAPQTIMLRFNATMEKTITQVYLMNGKEEKIRLEKVTESEDDRMMLRVPPLIPGVYTILYKVLARDGHVTEGSFHFTVLLPSFSTSEP